MGLFGRGKSGGLMNVIRCDEQEYLVWKWRPEGQDVNSTSRENGIRWGSSLRVKDGEVAVFVYKQKEGTIQDFIEGPFDETLKTANLPILSSILGLAYGGETPFQAEVYFINLAGIISVPFAVPYFTVSDPRFPDIAIPVAAGGRFTFKIEDYKAFIKLHRLINFSIEDFKKQIKDVVVRRVKNTITNAPSDFGMPLVQVERKIEDINDALKPKIIIDFEDFGVKVGRFDLSRIEPDKEAEEWRQLQSVTATIQIDTTKAQADVNIKNMQDMQEINARNLEETMRIQREEAQRAQRLQTETSYIGAHTLNRQADVLAAGANSLGQMGNIGEGSGGMNPAGMMTGMMLGGAMGSQMAGMMNQMGNAMNGQYQGVAATPPPVPQVAYMLSINGNQSGPYNMQQLQQLVQQGTLTKQTYVWKQGMANWEFAENVAELSILFATTPPPASNNVPPVPSGIPPTP